MDLDKYGWLKEGDIDYPPKSLDEQYIETALFALFKINLLEHLKVKAALTKQFHVAPKDFDDMYYWDYEIYLKSLNDLVKEENDSQKAEMDKYHINDYMDKARSGKLMETPKMPSMSGFGSGMSNMKFDMGGF